MKNFIIIILLIIIIIMGLAMNTHVIRTADGVEFIAIDHMNLRDIYVDVRDWSLTDYISHSARIRNYLMYEKEYKSLVEMAKSERDKSGKELLDIAKEKTRKAEKAIHEWVSDKLE